MLNFMYLLIACIIFSWKQTWMENLICTGHCAVCKSLISRILQAIYWDVSLMLKRKGRTVQDWRFIQQCDQRFKPLGRDTVLVAKWLLSVIAWPLKTKTQFLQTIRSHSTNGSITFKKMWFPKWSCLHYQTKPKQRQTGPTLFFTVSTFTVQCIYSFHHHTVCQTYIKKYSEVNGICFQHQECTELTVY